MTGFLIVSAVAIVLIASTSLLMYEALRFSWTFMARSGRRHGRILFALGAAFGVHIASIWMYGFAYYWLSLYSDVGTLVSLGLPDVHAEFSLLFSAYFSAATYSSLGFGDIVPTGHVRLIAGAEALNGLLLIGWSVTFSFLAMEEFWERLPPRKSRRAK